MIAYALAWPGALAIGISLGLLGSGGSILTVPVLVYLVGQDERTAIASSLAIVGLIALAAALPYIRSKQVHWRSVIHFGVPSMLGTFLGAAAAGLVVAPVQMAAFALVMFAAARQMLQASATTIEAAPTRPLARVVGDGLIVGLITGFVGVGGGFLIVPALVILGGLAMHQAVATSLVIIAAKSFTGFYKYLDVLDAEGLTLDLPVIATIATIGAVGSLVGSRLGCRIDPATLKRYFGYALVVLGACILLPILGFLVT